MTVKGQVTILKAVGERASLRPGMRVEVVNGENGVVVSPAAEDHDADDEQRYPAALAGFEAARQIYEAQRDPNNCCQNLTVDEFMADIREPLEPFELDSTVELA